MRNPTWMRRGGWLAAAALLLLSSRAAWAQGPPPMSGSGAPIRPSQYWLGLECYPVDDALRAHLDLPEGQGLLVAQTAPDSPAAEAGLRRYDVLVHADEKPLKSIQDLIDAVDAAKDNAMTLSLLRGGKPMTVEVTPTKRPEPVAVPGRPGLPFGEWDHLPKWLEQMRPGEGGRPRMKFRFLRPGLILPPGADAQPSLPAGLSIAITRTGDDPAKIVVKRGDETWELTENDLDQLPDDVRPHVERMLGRGSAGWFTDGGTLHFVPDEEGFPDLKGVPGRSFEEQMEQLDRKIEDLRRSIEQMRDRRPRLREAPKPEQKEAPEPELRAPEQGKEPV